MTFLKTAEKYYKRYISIRLELQTAQCQETSYHRTGLQVDCAGSTALPIMTCPETWPHGMIQHATPGLTASCSHNLIS
jgi:hypothetical protein